MAENRRRKKGVKDRTFHPTEPSMYGSENFRVTAPFKPYDHGLKTPERLALGAIHNKPSQKSLRRRSSGKGKQEKKRDAYESQVIDSETELSRWFMAGIPRDAVKMLAVELAASGEVGDFFIREKLGKQNTYALMVNEGVGKLLTFITKKVLSKRGHVGFQIEGAPDCEVFETIAGLVNFYASSRRLSLGVQLVCQSTDVDGFPIVRQSTVRPTAKFVRSIMKAPQIMQQHSTVNKHLLAPTPDLDRAVTNSLSPFADHHSRRAKGGRVIAFQETNPVVNRTTPSQNTNTSFHSHTHTPNFRARTPHLSGNSYAQQPQFIQSNNTQQQKQRQHQHQQLQQLHHSTYQHQQLRPRHQIPTTPNQDPFILFILSTAREPGTIFIINTSASMLNLR
eukprot:m.115207 g.115207  ORF g.115207 m.115207 type:complete len:393 (+) comp28405_c2_seq2:108-1286(+)